MVISFPWKAVLAPVLCLCASGCKAPAADSERQQPAEDVRPTGELTGGLVVSETGKEPLRVLRYQLDEARPASLVLSLRVRVTREERGKPLSEHLLPTIRIVADTSLPKDDDGRLLLTLRDAKLVDIAGHSAAVVARTSPELRHLSGAHVSVARTATGWSPTGNFTLPPTASPELRQIAESILHSLSHLGAPFPEDAVGVGARWTQTTPVTSAGLQLVQEVDYRLVAVDGMTGTLKADLRFTAPKQPARFAGAPKSMGELTEFTGSGNAEILFDLEGPLPLRARFSSADTAVYWLPDPEAKLVRAKSYVTLTAERM